MAASWILVPCLVSLRAEFNQLAPQRDKASDGSVGDLAHQQESSDHNPDETGKTPYSDADSINEVHAIDVDSDLHKPGWSMDRAVGIVVTRHRNGLDDRLQNIIWNRRIWSRSWGWTARAYTGASPHTEHAHFSARYITAQERDVSPWGLLEADDMDAAQMTAWAKSADGKAALGGALLDAPIKLPDGRTEPVRTLLAYSDAREIQTRKDVIAAVGQVDDELWAKLSDPATPDEQVAAALDQLLGARKAAVLAVWQSTGQVG